MKILFHVNWCYPQRRAGSERYTHEVAQYLVARGHEVWYLCSNEMLDKVEEPDFMQDGCRVIIERPGLDIKAHYDWADVVWSHLHTTRLSIDLCKATSRPLINCQHRPGQFPLYQVQPTEIDLVVYNSEWIKNQVEKRRKGKNYCVLVPPFSRADFECSDENKEFISHINCNEGKGVMLSRHYARDLPEYPFLFTMGTYFQQIIPTGTHKQFKHLGVPLKEVDFPPNCTYQGVSDNVVRDIYSKTKILVLPSVIDTWGMVGLEAMSSGIPVVAHPDPGFLEAYSSAGLFVDRKKAIVMRDLLTKLMENDEFYQAQSLKCLARAKQVEEQSQQQLAELYLKICDLVGV